MEPTKNGPGVYMFSYKSGKPTGVILTSLRLDRGAEYAFDFSDLRVRLIEGLPIKGPTVNKAEKSRKRKK
jgi:hypothetical protein